MSVYSDQLSEEPIKIIDNNVYDKFQQAKQNMSNFKQLLTKFSSNKKLQQAPLVQAFSVSLEPQSCFFNKEKFVLSEGWQYSGQIFEKKFHGFGILLFNNQTIYSGQFKCGKMSGLGKLRYNHQFEQLLKVEEEWLEYEGQFQGGEISGFGNLTMSSGEIIGGYWRKGKPLYYTKIPKEGLL